MRNERIYLIENNENVYLDTYVADKVGDLRRKAMLVLPGGGYSKVCFDREGEPVAMAFLPYGFSAFVLHYSVNRRAAYPAQLREVTMAIRHIKDHADDYGINPDQLFVVGFSAGGHLAASAGVFWNRPEVTEGMNIPQGYNKPRGIMPIYPVISYDAHHGTFRNLLCTDTPDEKDLEYVRIDTHVDENSAPAFIMHTADDQIVDARGSLRLALAYADAGVPYELHIYPHGPHGMALANALTDGGKEKMRDPAVARWVEHAAHWADALCK